MLGDLGRLSKSVFYESATKIPMIIRIPESSDYKPLRGTKRNQFTELIDIHATLLDISESRMWEHQDSISMLGPDKRNDVLSEVHVHYMLRNDKWKIVVGKNGNSLQLFDMQNDPLEQINLCGNEKYKQAELEMRSNLLNRLTKTTYRSGDLDPELSSHFINPDDT
jgi:arylsulfatase A-like enzyme